MFIIASIILFLTIFIIMPYFVIINEAKKEILALFLNLSEQTIQKLLGQIDFFNECLQLSNEDV